MRDTIEIAVVTGVTPEVVDAFARLVPQLAPSAGVPDEAQLQAMVRAPGTTLLVARDARRDGRIVGALTLTHLRIPTGLRVTIEDVVVDTASRGAGVGEALTRVALRLAREHGARSVDLTSNPSRESANRLYQRLGFARRETNVYRFDLTRDDLARNDPARNDLAHDDSARDDTA